LLSLYWLGLYEASSIKVYPKLFHVDYSGRLLHSESAGLYFPLVNLICVVLETVMIGFAYLFIPLFMFALFYGFYRLIILIGTIIPFTGPEMSEMGTLGIVVIGTLCFFAFIQFLAIVFAILIGIAGVTYFVFKGFIFIFLQGLEVLYCRCRTSRCTCLILLEFAYNTPQSSWRNFLLL